ncbi:MAG: single-stranded-DNA-specific exonuclease [Candidatus Berkelbacteria bacterium Licking1014_85]|uniref:Single-stranded-DNA-specific exonuclease RecJ n=1 Tax=Candidatus Berkelbacteria bacterium Licking1014_85 TaxID=2017148 RepID=A0A554LLK9_9BACT|nr:MAG: single-stranded-DNA-specific exonuclease [Candidatus Berkelbacteria bacterium Licking1014_85]
MQKYIWNYCKKTTDDVIDQILVNRAVDLRDKESFLNPDFFADQVDPRKIFDMKKGIVRFYESYKKNEKIGVFADYDADGISAAAILVKALEYLNIAYAIYIPSREEGYGLSQTAIDYFIEHKCSLVFSLDTGTTAKKEAEKCRRNNIDLIIIDHHIVQKDLFPDSAYAIINPKQKNEKTKFKEYSAGGLVWKFIYGLHLQYKLFPQNTVKWWLDLAAISTISDIVPLVGENRIIAKYGLKVLQKTCNLGLRKLYIIASIIPENISAYTIGFQIGPRLNASGRIHHANDSFYLLIENDSSKVKLLAEKINQTNTKRQDLLQKSIILAIKLIEKDNLDKFKIIVIKHATFLEGLNGLIASAIVEKYHRPTIVLSEKQDVLIGSARSIKDFDIEKTLEKSKKYLLRFGGHKLAAGLSLVDKNFAKFKKFIEEYTQKNINDSDLIPKINIDYTLDPKNITVPFIKILNSLEPHGFGNPKPIFEIKNIRIIEKRLVGKKSDHLSLYLENNIKAIGFGLSEFYDSLHAKNKISIAGTLNIDEWNNIQKVQIKIIDIKY